MEINDLTLRKLDLVEGDHIVLVAEAGFSMLDMYGRGRYGISLGNTQKFADRVNQSKEPGSPYPHEPICGMSRMYFRKQSASRDPSVFTEFQRLLREALETIAGPPIQTPMKTVVLDFRVFSGS